MACSDCKEKKEFKKIQPKTQIVDKTVSWIVLIWFLLGLYGLYSLISLIL